MGGYAFYVWSSLGLGLVVIVWNIVFPLIAHKNAIKKAGDFYTGQMSDGEH